MKLYLLFLFTAFAFAPPSTTAAATITKPRRIVTKLLHRDSIFSPSQKPQATTSSLSRARLTYLVAKARGRGGGDANYATDDIRSPVIAESSGMQFMANLSIGNPPVPQLLTMDTGSNLFWVQCLPCIKCFQQTSPLFDPSKSSKYTNLPCTSPSCSVLSRDKCDASNNCKFSQKYLDDTTVSGLLGTEDLTFLTSDEGITIVPHVLFGCAHDNDGYNGEPSGVLGLGPSNLSLVTQLGSKFSYCFGSIRDRKYPHNVLVLGDGADLEGDSTPLEVFNYLYYLSLEGVSVGDKRLEIDPEAFKRTPEGKGGVVIDSGTTVTYLVQGGYGPLTSEVKSLLDGKLELVKDPSNPNLCYKGVIERDLTGFPVVTLHFAGGAELGLDIYSFFQENGEGEFCLALQESEELSIIGVMAQQSYNVGFDIPGRKIAFQRIDCQLLDGA